MKKGVCFLLTGLAVAMAAFTEPPNKLVGRWQRPLPGGNMGIVIFRADSSYDAVVNGKIFLTSKYQVRQDTFVDRSGACRLAGTYKLQFFAEDSVRFTVIQDSCRGRREGYNGLTLYRAKPAKP